MVLPIGLVFEIMLFRSLLYHKTLDSVLRLRFSPADTLLHLFFAYGLQFPQGVYP